MSPSRTRIADLRRVYWAEDALDDQFLIRQALNQMAAPPEVQFFGDGAALVAAVGRRRPDLVVLDINMPVLDGIGALRRLRADPATRDLPAVLFSTARHERDVAAGQELRVLDFVQKPAHFDAFARAVERVLAPAAPGVGEPKASAARLGRSWSPAPRGVAARRD